MEALYSGNPTIVIPAMKFQQVWGNQIRIIGAG
jgi:UDP:flavonoid glycosyltransferase YjiC (YdhE family)